MGYGNYSYEAHQELTSQRAQRSREEVFQQTSVHPLLNPHGVRFRESRDSSEHPHSLPIIFALDVTGSMGEIPELLAKQELPTFMRSLLNVGVKDPQIMFMFLGDALWDRGPLQVGQFESTASDIDRWLTWAWLEAHGGGNRYESYDLAMYFAARHTDTDHYRKRHRRGYFFMTGDELPYPKVDRNLVRSLMGDELKKDVPLNEIADELAGAYHSFFLIPDPGRVAGCAKAWHKVMGDHVLTLGDPADTCLVAAALVALSEGLLTDLNLLGRQLTDQGYSRIQVGRVVTALTPYAATLGRDGHGRIPLQAGAW